MIANEQTVPTVDCDKKGKGLRLQHGAPANDRFGSKATGCDAATNPAMFAPSPKPDSRSEHRHPSREPLTNQLSGGADQQCY